MADRIRWTGTRYRDPETGRFVSRAAIRRALEESLTNLERRTDGLQDDLRAGRISLDAWREEMRLIIKQTHMAALELAAGGRAQTTQAQYGRAGQQIRRQYAYLEAWVEQIKAGLPIDNRMEPRAASYLKSALVAHRTHQRAAFQAQGFDQIRSIRHPGESCAECIAEEARGFVPIGQHVPIGQRQCLNHDNCTEEFRNSQTGEVLAA
jgi:hypothetical protein